MTVRGQRHLDVLTRTVMVEDVAVIWKRYARTQPPDLARLQARGILPQHMHAACIGRDVAR